MIGDVVAPAARPAAGRGWLPWLLWVISLFLGAAGIGFVIVNRAVTHEPLESVAADLLNFLLGFVTGLVGALIASRRRENPIGWLMLGAGLSIAVTGAVSGYAIYDLILRQDALPGGLLADWAAGWLATPQFLLLTLVALLYPTGRFLSSRWRIVAWAAAANVGLMILLATFSQTLPLGPNPETPLLTPRNPIGFLDGGLVRPLLILAFSLSSVFLIIALFSLAIRFKRSQGQERQQLKWFTYTMALLLLFQVPSAFVPDPWLQVLDNTASLLLPIAIGVAILRYHLYDIDILINRTLVYLPLTAILAGVFAASTALLQKLFLLMTGASSEAATVLTTLIVVAAFEPLKRGLQHLVDRRFQEAPDPARRLKAFDQQVQAYVQVADPDEITQRPLDETRAAFDATGGALFRDRAGRLELIRTSGAWNGQARVTIPVQATAPGPRVGVLSLGPRRNGSDYTQRDHELLESAARDVARAVLLARRGDPVPNKNQP